MSFGVGLGTGPLIGSDVVDVKNNDVLKMAERSRKA